MEYPDPRERLTPEQLEFIEDVRRAIVDRRQTVVLCGYAFRFVKRGERVENGLEDDAREALLGANKTDQQAEVTLATQPGVYVKTDMQRAGKPPGYWWRRLGFSDEIEDILARYVVSMPTFTMEAIRIRISASSRLQQIAIELHESRKTKVPG